MVHGHPVMGVEDMIITVAYFSIPLQILVSLYRYPRLASMPLRVFVLMVLFALFIFLCGTGHLIRCLGNSGTRIFQIVNWLTAFISLATALYLLPLVPSLMGSLDAGLQDLRRLNEETEESRRKLVTFMAFLCHEIRNPLFAVTSFCSFLQDETMTSSQQQALSSICQSTNLMLRLVNDVLDLSKLDSGQEDLQEETFQLRELLQNVCTGAEIQLRQKPGVHFRYELSPSLPDSVVGDRARILQICFNLLSNAAKFTGEGFIEFRASAVNFEEAIQMGWIDSPSEGANLPLSGEVRKPDTQVEEDEYAACLINAEEGVGSSGKQNGRVHIIKLEVSDTGTGIAHDQLERLFVPYSWSKLTDYREHGGTGLGLAILARLSRKMGGSIRVKSLEGAGSTFSVYMKLRVADSETYLNNFPDARNAMVRPVHDDTLPALIPTSNFSDFHGKSSELQHHSKPCSSIGPSATGHSKNGKVTASTLDSTMKVKPRLDLFMPESLDQQVLVVDDNHVNRKLLGRMLAHFNIKYELAVNGQQAIDIMMRSRNMTGKETASQFGLIIMDISMPVLDGCEATRILRRCNLDIPIIALTACAIDVSKQDAIDAGVTEFLTKPILRSHLFDKCRYYLGSGLLDRNR